MEDNVKRDDYQAIFEELKAALTELRQLTLKCVQWNIERNEDVMEEDEAAEMDRIKELWSLIMDDEG